MIFTLGSFIRLRCKQTSPGYSSKTHTSPAVLHALLLTMAIITAFAYKLWLQMYLTENWNNQSTHGRKITTSETFASPATRDAVHGSTQHDKHDEELDDYSNAVTYVFHRVGSDGNIHPSTGVEVTLEQLCKMIQLDAVTEEPVPLDATITTASHHPTFQISIPQIKDDNVDINNMAGDMHFL